MVGPGSQLMKTSLLPAVVVALVLGAMPIMTQAAGNGGAPSPSPTDQKQAANAPPPDAQAQPGNKPVIGTATINPVGIPPSERNPLLTDEGAVRVSKLIGVNIFNQDDQRIGSVQDILVGQDGKLRAVIATGDKTVAVPWNWLVFGDAKLNSDNTIIIPKETQKGLNKLPTFSYQNKKG